MKNKFRCFVLLVCLITWTSALNAQEEKYPETVLIKFIETTYSGASAKAESKIITVKPDNTVETIILERSSVLNDADEMLSSNQMRMRVQLQKWQNEGFAVKAMSSASPMNYLVVTTIIMTKN